MTTPILTSSSAVLMKAGKNVSDDIINGITDFGASCSQIMNEFINQAESHVIVTSGKNWLDEYATLNDDKKKLLDEAVSDLAAMYVINYDMSGFVSRDEAQTRLDLLRDRFEKCVELLQDKNKVTFTENT